MHLHKHCCHGKTLSIRNSECVCVCVCVCMRTVCSALVIQHAMCMSVVCLGLPYSSTLFHERNDFQKKVAEHKMCVLILSTAFVSNISHSKKNSAKILS